MKHAHPVVMVRGVSKAGEERSMGPGIIARVLIVAGVCGAAYFGFVIAAPAEGSVGESEFQYVVAAVAEPEPVDATVDALARLNQRVSPAPVIGGNARLRALFQGFEDQGIATGTDTRVKARVPQGGRAGKSNNVRPKAAMVRASRSSSSPWTRFKASRATRSASPWTALNDLRRQKVSIVRTRPKMYRPFEGRYLFHLTANKRPPDPPAVREVKSEYRRKWWQ
jgi:hypothetical protein